jgi:prepilin peptidase CpaA
VSLALLCVGAAGLALLIACLCDLRRFEIPDTLSIVILLSAFAFGLATPGFEWLWHLAGLGLMFAVGLGLFAAGWMGGGDIKLLVATAMWTGLQGLAPFLLGVSLAGGGLAIVLLGSRAALKATGVAHERMPGPLRPGAPMPYAIAITGGALWWAMRAWPLA